MQLAAYLFEMGVFSSGQAAELDSIGKRQLLERVDNYGILIFSGTFEEIEILLC